jgi:hypothetical protein
MCVVQKDSTKLIKERTSTDAEGWQRCEHLSKTQADQLLDWLEVNGFSRREVTLTEDGSFTVRWRK